MQCSPVFGVIDRVSLEQRSDPRLQFAVLSQLQQLLQRLGGQSLSGQIQQQLILTKTELLKTIRCLQQIAQVNGCLLTGQLLKPLPGCVFVQDNSLAVSESCGCGAVPHIRQKREFVKGAQRSWLSFPPGWRYYARRYLVFAVRAGA